MTTTIELTELAQQMKRAQDERSELAPFTGRVTGFDVKDGYAVSHLIHDQRVRDGAVPLGRKIGFTNPAMWVVYGVGAPIWAYVYDSTVQRVTAQARTCSLGRFVDPKIEPEIVLHFRSAPPAGGDLEAILDCIDWVAHGFEIVQSHFPGWRFQAADTIADSGLHGALLLGEPVPVARLGPNLLDQLKAFSIDLSSDGTIRDTGVGSNVLGGPLAAIAHLISVLATLPNYRPLQAGELVTTGTITAAMPIRAGETWHTALRGIDLPGLSVDFVP